MAKKQAPEESKGESAPLWIISFADMISLLMAFFVMLQTLASEKSNEFLNDGAGKFKTTMGEFRRNIDGFGVPDLIGRPQYNRDMVSYQKKYALEGDNPQVPPPAIDGKTEKIQRLFTQLSELSKTQCSQIKGQKLNFQVTPITFTGQDYALNSEAKNYLTQFVSVFRETKQADNATIYVMGFGADMDSPQQSWIVSEGRSRAVGAYLQSLMPEKNPDDILWWGAGSNTDALLPETMSNTFCILTAIGTRPQGQL